MCAMWQPPSRADQYEHLQSDIPAPGADVGRHARAAQAIGPASFQGTGTGTATGAFSVERMSRTGPDGQDVESTTYSISTSCCGSCMATLCAICMGCASAAG
eukprot:CAMPEP_0204343982 /NCGR_PEP_ID=MMETSP0469-20131031/25288_1 /ASSEMBLY_ACC=CAM_ASM_000384 /TAXON_ID=2969 /ORGANISM="Oxyrrhis marina" /LENGTH=101 /DNA_ID=CAMNT_0051329173 /DNA_START=15 /DNA_END=320 /DNA_ORIENTATION=+